MEDQLITSKHEYPHAALNPHSAGSAQWNVLLCPTYVHTAQLHVGHSM